MEYSLHSYGAPPSPKDPIDVRRWSETRRRRRLLSGLWQVDLEQKLRAHFGLVRRAVMGPQSRAKNPFKRTCEELASLYLGTPRIWHESQDGLDAFVGPDGLIAGSGRWVQMRRFQVEVLGLRENLTRIDLDARGRPVYRTVYPDTVEVKCAPDDPGRPIAIREIRWRCCDQVPGKWAWDELSIENPDNPTYRIVEHVAGEGIGEDLTAALLGGEQSGEAYPYRYTQGDRAGEPYLPYPLYHAEYACCPFDAFCWLELVEASLDLACLWTFWQHAVFRASWPQRWAINAYVAGTITEDTDAGRRQAVPTDPTSLIHLEAGNPGVQPQVGQWAPSVSVLELEQAVSAFERSVVAITGIDAAHIVRESADAWSGAALSISRDGKREAQRIYEPQFRAADLELIEKTAALLNRAHGSALPESGYRIAYETVPLSPQELEAKRTHNTEMIAAGRMSVVDAYRDEHPGMSHEEAMRDLERVQIENAMHLATAAASQSGRNPPPVEDGAAPMAPVKPATMQAM